MFLKKNRANLRYEQSYLTASFQKNSKELPSLEPVEIDVEHEL